MPSQVEDGEEEGGQNPGGGGGSRCRSSSVCVPLSPLRMCRQLSPPTQWPGLLQPGAEHSCINRERPGIPCLEAAAPVH